MWSGLLLLDHEPVLHVTGLNTGASCNSLYYDVMTAGKSLGDGNFQLHYKLLGPLSYMRSVALPSEPPRGPALTSNQGSVLVSPVLAGPMQGAVPGCANTNTGYPATFTFQISNESILSVSILQHLDIFILKANLKFKCHWASWVLSGNPKVKS